MLKSSSPVPSPPMSTKAKSNPTDDTPVVWDAATQQYHGGQEWKYLSNFVEDFSVTTNGLGTPVAAMEAAKRALSYIHHYPPADQEPAKSDLAVFLTEPNSSATPTSEIHSRLLLGNGASELIDLVTRAALVKASERQDGIKPVWRSGPWIGQYKEYERSAKSHGFKVLPHDSKDKADLTCIVNPNNPTGDYVPIEEMMQWIDANVKEGGFVMVDESMHLWLNNFRSDSLVSATSSSDGSTRFVESMFKRHNIHIYVIHSWTKIWSCTGIRLGSVVCPTSDHAVSLKTIQVPWSVNCMALDFLSAACKDFEFLQETWDKTASWRKDQVEDLRALLPMATIHGHNFLSWIWVDVHHVDLANKLVESAKKAGCPVRPGEKGYNLPTCVRLAVRSAKTWNILKQAWVDALVKE